MHYIQKITSFLRVKTIWLGTSSPQEKLFSWITTNKEPTYNIPWAPKFPSKLSSQNSCLSMITSKLSFINAECFEMQNFVCKMIPNNPSNINLNMEESTDDIIHNYEYETLSQWAEGTYTGSSKFYVMHPDTHLTWNEARSFCKSHKMDLVFIDSDEKITIHHRSTSSIIFKILAWRSSTPNSKHTV